MADVDYVQLEANNAGLVPANQNAGLAPANQNVGPAHTNLEDGVVPALTAANAPALPNSLRFAVEQEAWEKTCGNPYVTLGLIGAAVAAMLSLAKLLVDEKDASTRKAVFSADVIIYACTLLIEAYGHYQEIEKRQVLFYLFATHRDQDGKQRSPGVYNGAFANPSGFILTFGILCITAEIIAECLEGHLAAGIIGIVAPIITSSLNSLQSTKLKEQFEINERIFIRDGATTRYAQDYCDHGGIEAYRHLIRGPIQFFYHREVHNQATITSLSRDKLLPLRMRPGQIR